MDINNAKKTARKAGGVVLVAAGIGMGVWLSLILTDILTVWWVYSSIDKAMDDFGISVYGAKLVAVAFAAMGFWFANMTLLKILRRDKRWVLAVGGSMAVWFLLMYTVSSPYTSGLFNPFSGKARAVFIRMPDNTIKSFPIGVKFDPDTGKKLEEFDQATAEEYQKQEEAKKKAAEELLKQEEARQKAAEEFQKQEEAKKKAAEELEEARKKALQEAEEKQKELDEKNASVWTSLTNFFGIGPNTWVSSKDPSDNLTLWTEKIQLAPDRTIIYLACKGKDGKPGWLDPGKGATLFWSQNQTNYSYNPRTPAYLVDNSGMTYDVLVDGGYYNTLRGNNPFFGQPSFWPAHYIKADEIYHFTMVFQPLQGGISKLRLHHPSFEPLDLDVFLPKAERIPAIPPLPLN